MQGDIHQSTGQFLSAMIAFLLLLLRFDFLIDEAESKRIRVSRSKAIMDSIRMLRGAPLTQSMFVRVAPSPPSSASFHLEIVAIVRPLFNFAPFVTKSTGSEEDFFALSLRVPDGMFRFPPMKNKTLMDILLQFYVTCGCFKMPHGAYISDGDLLQDASEHIV